MSVFKTLLNKIPRPLLIKVSLWLRPGIDLFYRGNTYRDPINGKNYRKFLPYGYENLRANALAPGTLSLERHRLLWLYLQTTDFFSKKLEVLHVAPEQCFHKRFKNQGNLKYTTTDLFSPLADIKADLCDLPFESNSFDWVLCNHVLEHIPDDKKAMSEILRVLRPGGRAILQIPMDYDREETYEDAAITDPEQRKIHFGQYDHLRVYGLDYFQRLEEVGFVLSQEMPQKNLSKTEIQQFALQENEVIPVAYKPDHQL